MADEKPKYGYDVDMPGLSEEAKELLRMPNYRRPEFPREHLHIYQLELETTWRCKICGQKKPCK